MSSIDELTIALSIDQSTEFKELLSLLKTFKQDAGEAVRAGRGIDGLDPNKLQEINETLEVIQTRLDVMVPMHLTNLNVATAAGNLKRYIQQIGVKEYVSLYFKHPRDIEKQKERLGVGTGEEVIDILSKQVETGLRHLEEIELFRIGGPKSVRIVDAMTAPLRRELSQASLGMLKEFRDAIGEEQPLLDAFLKSLIDSPTISEFHYKMLRREEALEKIPEYLDDMITNIYGEFPDLENLYRKSQELDGELQQLYAYLGEEIWNLKTFNITAQEWSVQAKYLLYYLEKLKELKLGVPHVTFFEKMFGAEMTKFVFGKQMTQKELYGAEYMSAERIDAIIKNSPAFQEALDKAGISEKDKQIFAARAIIAIEQIIDKIEKHETRRISDIKEPVLLISKQLVDLPKALRDEPVAMERHFAQVLLERLLGDFPKKREEKFRKELKKEKEKPQVALAPQVVLPPPDIKEVKELKRPKVALEIHLQSLEKYIKLGILTTKEGDTETKNTLEQTLKLLENLKDLLGYKKEDSRI